MARSKSLLYAITALMFGALVQSGNGIALGETDRTFTIAVIPDTQNYLNYKHQKGEGFPFDAADLFLEQMQYISDNTVANGGDIAFVTSLGDIWQHQTLRIDPDHYMRGFRVVSNPMLDDHLAPTFRSLSEEMPVAKAGYEKLMGLVPFSVVPGNHDYDAMWTDAKRPPSPDATFSDFTTLGALHAGGLSNFRAVFGAKSEFFAGNDWYVDSHDGGADSAQIFEAGGYKFLHIGLQFAPPDATLEWANKLIARYPGLPTIISTHEYINARGERLANPIIDHKEIDPMDNSPEDVWQKLIYPNDQIFLVLCGHQHGQAMRIDKNSGGHNVYQILADYQDRKQSALNYGYKFNFPSGVGDGWFRLMTFDLGKDRPEMKVRTYSSYYRQGSRDTPEYAMWYRDHEQPDMTNAEFHDADDYTVVLDDFRNRFGAGVGRE